MSGEGLGRIDLSPARREALVQGQAPFAVILSCADSRVPVELLFDQGLGDLFVIRVAGNIATPAVLGSIEYAAAALGTRLIVVLGHTGCGAVKATLNAMADGEEAVSPNLQSIVDAIRPAVERLGTVSTEEDVTVRLRKAVRANVEATTQQVRTAAPVLDDLVQQDGLVVLGAEYALETGMVTFFEGLPETG